jgi:hypothetical protein
MDTLPFKKFLGINNRLPDFALATEEGHFLRSADNVDIDDSFAIRRRSGTAIYQAMSNPHSLHLTDSVNGFMVRASTLYAVVMSPYSEVLLKILTSDATMSYAQLGDSWYFSNGTDKGRVTSGVAYPMGLPTPTSPALTVIGGNLLPGAYQVGTAYYNNVTGEEGGVSFTGNIILNSVGGIRVTLPTATIGATHINIYVTTANGGIPMFVAAVTTGTSTYDIITDATGREANERHEDILPAGTLFSYNGRLCSYAGSMVYVGLPFRPGYYLPTEGYIPFPSAVSIIVPNQTGVFIAADKTYYVSGDLGDVQNSIIDVLPYGAIAGTAFVIPYKAAISNSSKTSDREVVGWFGVRGFVMADLQGVVTVGMSDNIDITPPSLGTVVVHECDGYRRVVSCGYCMNLSNGAVTTYSDWGFSSVSGCYGTKPDGVYLTDTTGTVDASVGFGKQNFGTEQKKNIPAVYIGMDSVSLMVLTVDTPVGVSYTYNTKHSGTGMQMQRIDPGKGLWANWFDLTLTNTEGADFTLASVSFGTTTSTRRI